MVRRTRRRRPSRSRRSVGRARRSLGRTLLEMRGLRQSGTNVYQSRRVPVGPSTLYGGRSIGVPVFVGGGSLGRRRRRRSRSRSLGYRKGQKLSPAKRKKHAAAARTHWRKRKRKYGKSGRAKAKRRRSLGMPRYYQIGRPSLGRRHRRRSRGLFGLNASTPFIGGLQWLATKKGIEAGVGVLGGRAVAEITTALAHEYLFKDAVPGDMLPNVVGDLAGAAVSWEIGKAVSPNIAAFAAASAATRWLQSKVTEMVTNPIIEKAAPTYYASMPMAPASLPNGTAPTEGSPNGAGMYGLGQVRMDDDVALGQVRVPDYPDMEGFGMGEDSLFG